MRWWPPWCRARRAIASMVHCRAREALDTFPCPTGFPSSSLSSMIMNSHFIDDNNKRMMNSHFIDDNNKRRFHQMCRRWIFLPSRERELAPPLVVIGMALISLRIKCRISYLSAVLGITGFWSEKRFLSLLGYYVNIFPILIITRRNSYEMYVNARIIEYMEKHMYWILCQCY